MVFTPRQMCLNWREKVCLSTFPLSYPRDVITPDFHCEMKNTCLSSLILISSISQMLGQRWAFLSTITSNDCHPAGPFSPQQVPRRSNRLWSIEQSKDHRFSPVDDQSVANWMQDEKQNERTSLLCLFVCPMTLSIIERASPSLDFTSN